MDAVSLHEMSVTWPSWIGGVRRIGCETTYEERPGY